MLREQSAIDTVSSVASYIRSWNTVDREPIFDLNNQVPTAKFARAFAATSGTFLVDTMTSCNIWSSKSLPSGLSSFRKELKSLLSASRSRTQSKNGKKYLQTRRKLLKSKMKVCRGIYSAKEIVKQSSARIKFAF